MCRCLQYSVNLRVALFEIKRENIEPFFVESIVYSKQQKRIVDLIHFSLH